LNLTLICLVLPSYWYFSQ